MNNKIRNAVISVYDKNNLKTLLKYLHKYKVKLLVLEALIKK